MTDKVDIKDLHSRALDLFDKGKYDDAEELFKQILEINHNFADVLNKLGVILNLKGKLNEASIYFERALALNPAYTEAALNLAITYNELGETGRASQVFERANQAAKRSPGEIDTYTAGKLANEHYKIGNIYLDMGRMEEAIEEFRKALRLRSGLPDIHTKLAVALRERGRFEEALSELDKAKAANIHYGPARVQLGLTLYKQGRASEAFAEWESALEDIPTLKEARSFLNIFKHGK